MKGIKLTQGQFAVVDEEDYYYLNEFKWYFYRRRNQVYAKTCVTINKKRVHLFMHRLIMDASKKCVDHINGNGLDNRKSNLRLCERHENALNRVINYNNVSGYKGVSWFKPIKKWRAQIQYKKVVYYLGCFDKRIDAARAYNDAALKYHGEFANLNKID